MNRSVMDRQMFRNGGVVRMQEGGMAPTMPSASPTIPSMPVDPNSVDLPQAAQYAMQNGIDPQAIESMLGQYASQMQDLDNAEDYETVINGIRGDDLPIEARYQELAQIVGPEDSQATPESVLALVQPVMLMAAVDQGIGGLAQDQMAAPVEGAMAEGIMSTVDMGAAEAPNPVNFNQGGPVQYMAAGGPPVIPQALQQGFDAQKALMGTIYTPEQREADMANYRNQTQAQMLFDIASGALNFAAGGGKPGGTPAEQLAASFSPVLQNIGARAGELTKYQQGLDKEKRAMDLAALQTAQSEYQAKLTRDAARGNVGPGETYTLKDENGEVLWTGPIAAVYQQEKIQEKFPTGVNWTKAPDPKAPDLITLINPANPQDFHVINKNLPTSATTIQTLLQQKNPDGTPVYREGGTYTPSADRNTPNIKSFVVTAAGNDYGKRINLDLSNPEDKERYDRERDGLLLVTTPTLADVANDTAGNLGLGNSFNARFIQMVSDPELIDAYSTGALDIQDPAAALRLNNALSLVTTERTYTNDQGVRVTEPRINLSQTLLSAIQRRAGVTRPDGSKLDMPTIGGQDSGPQVGALAPNSPLDGLGRMKFNPDGTIDFSEFQNDRTFVITGVDLTQSQDWRSGVNRFFNAVAGQIGPVLGRGGYAGESGEITSKADTQLERLANQIMRIARADTDGRFFALDAQLLEQEVNGFKPGTFKTDVGARDALVTTRNSLAGMYADLQLIVMAPQNYPDTIETARMLSNQLERMLAETTGAIAIYDRYITNPLSSQQGAASDAASLRPGAVDQNNGNATGTVTGTLPRLSSQ